MERLILWLYAQLAGTGRPTEVMIVVVSLYIIARGEVMVWWWIFGCVLL